MDWVDVWRNAGRSDSEKSSSFSVSRELTKIGSNLLNSWSSASLWYAMLAAYLLAILLGANPLIAGICGLAYGLSTVGIMYIGAGHNTKVRTIALLPGVMAGVIWAFRSNMWKGAAIAALFTALVVSAGHPQMVYYLLFLMVAVGVSEVVRMKRESQSWRRISQTIACLALGGIAGVLPSVSGLMETKAYSEYTMRGDRVLESNEGETNEGLANDYILEYSMSGGEWWAIMCPDFKGGGNSLYWGEQRYSSAPFYFGAVICLFFMVFLFAGRDRLKWPILVISILAIVLSRRELTGVMQFFLDYVPFFKQFRDTKMMLVLVQLSVVIGGALGLSELLQLSKSTAPNRDRLLRRWAAGFAAFMALFGVFFMFPESIFDFQPFLRSDPAAEQLGLRQAIDLRVELFRADILRTLGLWLAAGLLVFIWMKAWIKSVPILLAIGCLVLGDMWLVDRRYSNEEKMPGGEYVSWVKRIDAGYPFETPPAFRAVLNAELPQHPEIQEDADRLFDAYKKGFGKKRLSRYENERLKEIAQFGALRFADHFRVLRWGALWNESETSYFFQSIGGYHGAKLRRYSDFIHEILVHEIVSFGDFARANSLEMAFDQFVCIKMLNTKYVFLADNSEPLLVSERNGAGWVASDWSFVSSANAEIDSLKTLSDAKACIILDEFETRMADLAPGAKGSVALTAMSPDALEYEVNIDDDALVVFSEIWYPVGWVAKIDGEIVDPIRVNYLFRALNVPAGQHNVTWEYTKEEGGAGWVTLANILLILFVVVAFWKGIKLN